MLQPPGLPPRLPRACLCPCPPGLTQPPCPSASPGRVGGQQGPKWPPMDQAVSWGSLLSLPSILKQNALVRMTLHLYMLTTKRSVDEVQEAHPEDLVGCQVTSPSSTPGPHGTGPARGSRAGAPRAQPRPVRLRGPCSEGFRLPSAVPGWKLGDGEGLARRHLRGRCREGAANPWSGLCSSQLLTPGHSNPAPAATSTSEELGDGTMPSRQSHGRPGCHLPSPPR